MTQPKKSGSKQAGQKLLASGVDPNVGKDTQFKPGVSGNPAGKPKGTVHLSTHIRNMLNDPDFFKNLPEVAGENWRQWEGTPMKGIIQVATIQAMCGNKEAREWLAKFGYGTKPEPEGDDDAEGVVAPRVVSTIVPRGTADAGTQS